MSEEINGCLYQEYEPTPDKPCEITGKNLLENGEMIVRRVPIKYVDDYVRLKNNWNELKKWLEDNWKQSQDIWYVKIINKMQEIEKSDSNE